MKRYRFYCLALLMAGSLGVYAQDEVAAEDSTVAKERASRPVKANVKTRTVSGRVMSAATKSPVAGALVSVSGYSGYSALTDEDGTFKFEIPEYATALKVTAPDFNDIRCGVNKSGVLQDIMMYSTTMRAKYEKDVNILNNAVADNFDYSSAINISSEIGDQLGAAVHTVSRSGTPGMGSYMTIGGISSLHGNAQPLIVIDGVILDQQYDRSMLHDGFYNDVLTALDVNDIAKVEVMANGTAIYGAKGANGVILITTKRCSSLATKIDATVSAGITLLPKSYSVMNAAQFKNYASDMIPSTKADITDIRFLNTDKNYYWYNKYNNDTDWDDYIYREAFQQNYKITVQGGGDVASYALSMGYTGAQSTMEENNMNRLNIRFNTDIKLSDHFNFRFDTSFSNTTRNLKDQGAPSGYDEKAVTSLNFLGWAKSPMLSPYVYANGAINPARFDPDDEDYINEVAASSDLMRNANWRLSNPAAINEYGTARNKNYFENSFVNIALTPEWNVNKHLNISSLFSYTLTNTSDVYYVPLNGVPSYYVSTLKATMDNEMRSMYAKSNSILSDTRVKWGNQYDAHTIDVMGGFRYMHDSYAVDTQLGYNTGNDKTPAIGGTVNKFSSGSDNSWTSVAWYAQARYNYRERYYLQGDLAIESSSRFGRDVTSGFKMCGVPWGVFPSIQAAWVVTNEDWLNIKGVDYFKLTLGYSMSGNDGIEGDASRTYFNSVLFMTQANGLTLGNIGNTRVQWETNHRFNVGFDMNVLKNRLNIRFNYFRSKTNNLLTLKEVGFVSGMTSNWSNGGSLKNRGYDISFNAHLLARKDWNWELGASVGHYKNKLTALPDGQDYIETNVYGATVRSQIGQPVNMFYGYKTGVTSSGTCVYATTDEAAADGLYLVGINGEREADFGAGDVKFVDQNGDKIINEKDMQVIGNPNPDIYGNIFTSVTYKRLRLDINFNYSLGNDVFNYTRMQLESGSRFMNQTTAMVNRWRYEGQATDMPKAAYGDPMGNSRFSDRWIEDGSYLRLKSLTLSYELPINNTYIHGLTFWGQANNLFTLTRYIGLDPEFSLGNGVLEQGIDRGLLAHSRNFMLGIKINL